jgi:hypothetical protein
MSNYYIYRHIRLDKDEVFYIGMSKKLSLYSTFTREYRRAFSYKSRNEKWSEIVNATKYKVEIIFETNNYEEACKKEKEFISIYGKLINSTGTLVNIKDGGGSPGFVRSYENKIKIGKIVYVWLKDGTYIGEFPTTKLAQEALKIDAKQISAAASGKVKSCYDYYLSYEKIFKYSPKLPKLCYQFDSKGNFIREWEVMKAEKSFGSSGDMIGRAARTNGYSKGFLWSNNRDQKEFFYKKNIEKLKHSLKNYVKLPK